MAELVFLKLGGSLITDKTREATPRLEVIERLAGQVRAALEARPELGLVLGHGSGSFGHFAARRHHIQEGLAGADNWRGYAETGAAAARLNRIIADVFLAAGVPVVSFPPSASARCRGGELIAMETALLREALSHRLVPLIFGDVAFDAVKGTTIVSTEMAFVYLAREFKPQRIVLAGQVAGVFTADPRRGEQARLVARLTPADFERMREQLAGSHGVDVTGGMLNKVEAMVNLVRELPGLRVHFVSGETPGLVKRVLTGECDAGTLLTLLP